MKRFETSTRIHHLRFPFPIQTALIIGAMFAMLKMSQPTNPPQTTYHAPASQEMRLPAPIQPEK